ncbi:MAG: hypothetical protein ACK56I_08920, partial [bacterium]
PHIVDERVNLRLSDVGVLLDVPGGIKERARGASTIPFIVKVVVEGIVLTLTRRHVVFTIERRRKERVRHDIFSVSQLYEVPERIR